MRISTPKSPDTLRQKGFTLMELSIVLVIIGVLVGAIVSGQHLVHTMRLNKISEEFQNYQSNIILFAEKYRAIPGDMPNATDYWGAVNNTTQCLTPSTSASGNAVGGGNGTETCNGNGDQALGSHPNQLLTHETFRLWQHLYNAGLVPGAYTGFAESGDGNYRGTRGGINAPKSVFSGSAWGTMWMKDYSSDTYAANWQYNRTYGNMLVFGAETPNLPPFSPILTPQEARSLDQKIDDATPAGGNVTAVLGNFGTNGSKCTTGGTNSNALTAKYDSDFEGVACALYMILADDVRGPAQ